MAPKSKIVCKKRRVYPVRYALTSELQPPRMKTGNYNFPYAGPEISGYQFTLRRIRDGYIHIYLPDTKKMFSIAATGGQFGGKAWIEIPMEAKKLYIAYSPAPWTQKYWGEVKTANFARMQEVDLNDEGTGKHTGLSGPWTPFVVEEHRFDKAGWLDSMREKLSHIFHPVPLSGKTQPEETAEQRGERWKHSGVPFQSAGIKGGCTPKPLQDQPVSFDNEHPCFMAEDPCRPLLIAVYDAIGVGQDLATLHAADLEAMDHLAEWYSPPAISSKFLNHISTSLAKQKDDQFKNWYDYLNPLSWYQESKIDDVIKTLPKTGWKEFTTKYDGFDKEIETYSAAFRKLWQKFLCESENTSGSLREALKDFDTNQDPELENAFARTHFLIAYSPEGIELASEVYVTSTAEVAEGAFLPPPNLLKYIIRGINQRNTKGHITDNTVLIVNSFFPAMSTLSTAEGAEWLEAIHDRLFGMYRPITPFEPTLSSCIKAMAETCSDEFKEFKSIVPFYQTPGEKLFTGALTAYSSKLNMNLAGLIALRHMDTTINPGRLVMLGNVLVLIWAMKDVTKAFSDESKTGWDQIEAVACLIAAGADIAFMVTRKIWQAWFPASVVLVIGFFAQIVKFFSAVEKGKMDIAALAFLSGSSKLIAFVCMARKLPYAGVAALVISFGLDVWMSILDTPESKAADLPDPDPKRMEAWIKGCSWQTIDWKFDFAYSSSRFTRDEKSPELVVANTDLGLLHEWISDPKVSCSLKSSYDLKQIPEYKSYRFNDSHSYLTITAALHYFDVNSSEVEIELYLMYPDDQDTNNGYFGLKKVLDITKSMDRSSKRLLISDKGPWLCVWFLSVIRLWSEVANLYRSTPSVMGRLYLVAKSTFKDNRTKHTIERVSFLCKVDDFGAKPSTILSDF